MHTYMPFYQYMTDDVFIVSMKYLLEVPHETFCQMGIDMRTKDRARRSWSYAEK